MGSSQFEKFMSVVHEPQNQICSIIRTSVLTSFLSTNFYPFHIDVEFQLQSFSSRSPLPTSHLGRSREKTYPQGALQSPPVRAAGLLSFAYRQGRAVGSSTSFSKQGSFRSAPYCGHGGTSSRASLKRLLIHHSVSDKAPTRSCFRVGL